MMWRETFVLPSVRFQTLQLALFGSRTFFAHKIARRVKIRRLLLWLLLLVLALQKDTMAMSWRRSTCWLLVLGFLWSPVRSLAAEAAAGSVAGDETEIDLYSLSDAELEEICTVRGFELMNDEDNTVFTHDDYVEAARQCLAIEQDM